MKRPLPQSPRPARARGRRGQILIALAVAGVMLFNFPLLLVWDQGATLLGLPSLPVALFLIWGGLIALLAWVSERDPDPSDGAPPARGPDGDERA